MSQKRQRKMLPREMESLKVMKNTNHFSRGNGYRLSNTWILGVQKDQERSYISENQNLIKKLNN